MRVYLIVIGGEKEGMVIPATGKQFLIGRDEGCHLRLKKKRISPKHCAILTQNHQAYLEDLGSANGTVLNDELIYTQHELESGDRFEIGEVLFEVRLIETKDGDDFHWDNASDPQELIRWLNKHSSGQFSDQAYEELQLSYAEKAALRRKRDKKKRLVTGLVALGGTLVGLSFMPTAAWQKLYNAFDWSWILLGIAFITAAAIIQYKKATTQ